MIIRNYIAGFLTWNPVLAELLDIDKKGIERIRKEVSKNRMTFKRNNELRTLTAEGQGQALMGWGSDLCLVDEICDIDYEVYRSKITRMLGDNPESVYIEIGNPNHRDGQMWQHWTNPNWHHVHIDYTIALSEKRISQDFIDEQKSILTDREFGILYRAEFPEESEDQLIHWSWIQEAIKSEKKLIGEVVAGADIAEKGNDTTVLTIGIKDKLTGEYETTKIMHWDQAETMTTVGRIAEAIKEMGIKRITVDSSGIGAGVYSRLQELRSEKVINCIVKDYRGGKSPSNKASQARYLNQKAEAYFNLRELFEKKKIKLIKDNKLVDELTKMKWELTSSMKIKILDPGTSAEDTAEEKSPDYCFIAGTKILTPKGYVSIENLKIGGLVITPYGSRKIKRIGNRKVSQLLSLRINKDNNLLLTANHKIYANETFKYAKDLTIYDKLSGDGLLELLKWRIKNLLNTKERSIGFQVQKDITMQTIITAQEKSEERKKPCIVKSGKTNTNNKSQKDTTYIILTETLKTIILIIWNWLKNQFTEAIIKKNIIKNILKKPLLIYKMQGKKLKNGTNQKPANNGINYIIWNHSKQQNITKSDVNNAMRNLTLQEQNQRNSAEENAICSITGRKANGLIKEFVNFAKKILSLTNMAKPAIVQADALHFRGGIKVYNIEVEKDHVYYADGILVSNSDSLCYMCWEGGTPSMVIMGGEMFWKKPDASDAADVASQSKMVSSGSLAGSSLN